MRRLLLCLALALVVAAPARAETVYGGAVADARLALTASGAPVVAYVAHGALTLATRDAGGTWSSRPLLILPTRDVELDGVVVAATGRVTVVARDGGGRWLGVASGSPTGAWRWLQIAPGARGALIGPAGLTLDRAARPVLAYAVWNPSHATKLLLVRFDAAGKPHTSGVTRKGFPPSVTLPAAAPVLMPSGQIHVVETYNPAAIDWGPIPGDWLGQFLNSSALGSPVGRISATVSGSALYAAWTEAYPTLGPPAVVLAQHGKTASSAVAIEDAVLAALAATPQGPELAANRCSDSSCIGLVGGASVDGVVADFAVTGAGARDLLLAQDTELDWFSSPADLPVRVSLARDLTGTVTGATGGTVTLYRESADGTRAAVGSFPVGADGSFRAADPTGNPVATTYRAVYVDPATSIPYAALLPPG